MALPTHKGDAVIQFLMDAGNRFDNLEIEVEKLRADAMRSETESVALCNQVTTISELTEQAATKTETDAFRNQVTAMAEQVVAVAKGAADGIPEGPSRPCPLCRNPANALRYSTVVCS